MADELSKQPETHIRLRYAETEHILKALELLPDESKTSVTHTDLKRQLTIIRDHWLKIERSRKSAQRRVVKSKKAR